MDNNNQNTAADDLAAEFIGSLFAVEVPTTAGPTPAPAEKSAGAEQIVRIPISE